MKKIKWYMEMATAPNTPLAGSLYFLLLHTMAMEEKALSDKHGEAAVSLVRLLRYVMREFPPITSTQVWLDFVSSKGTCHKLVEITDDMDDVQ
jgi:hypothetical protein